ncbi:bifunctional glutamate N-acetyltransferase/amino-acid acetyltransferase ArgJ [Clostridium tetanomorphum]|uniref:Arginine biosynthesis bifunctional protein ArgJ n=1 Tax=Clostridium tetanomorphum TaxID=1553 RepID=A0A923EDW8_CLOTT|nr:bifunctional glutamate N-acetyltransferase/amino-acid acetyltransferase ArgJ [Clostridium tetanomorphum]MBC2398958.1 bifunctional glutamate N-acetyltransferase/amino-acid acetyltransferase ArgJ [Clostridium tetanomorphum]NRZ95422.1 glutamate N-acetyltransferase/amino-acid N-acetyltransferase [Clostridium tetanomorphum]
MKILSNSFANGVKGFKTAGIAAGLKKSCKKDLAIIYSEKNAVSAGTFTTNKVKAACVVLNMENIKHHNTQAIIINSGHANACTGDNGFKDAKTINEITSKELGLKSEEVLQASTGVIGLPIPMDIMKDGIKKVCSKISNDGGDDTAKAILTTDTKTKYITIEIEIDSKKVLLSGVAKGSGMIKPNMATMLSFVVTDANISKEMLNKAVKNSVKHSYNMISVDGDISTNDMFLVMANGAAENKIIDCENDNYKIFKEALDFINIELAKKIARDGEGATKLIESHVVNSCSVDSAKKCAMSIVSSNLVKAALFGSDPNWGRVICALGYSGGEFSIDKVNLTFKSSIGEIEVFKNGMNLNFDENKARNILQADNIILYVDLNDGKYSAKAWGCDLTYKYVEINGQYRT